jgi:hypothetical protein
MKLGNIIAGMIIAACAYLIYQKLGVNLAPLNGGASPTSDGAASAPATASSGPAMASPSSPTAASAPGTYSPAGTSAAPGTSPAPMAPPASAVSAASSVPAETNPASARAELQLRMVNVPRWKFAGKVVRHLQNGMLLVQGVAVRTTEHMPGGVAYLAIFDMPDAQQVADGVALDGLACAYGSTSTPYGEVPCYLYTDHDAFDLLPKFDHFGKPINRDPHGPFLDEPEAGRQNPLDVPSQSTRRHIWGHSSP